MAFSLSDVSNPFRGSLPLHHFRRNSRSDARSSFQTPFEDHCHFIRRWKLCNPAMPKRFKPLSRITATSSPDFAGHPDFAGQFQTPFEDHCHFIDAPVLRWPPPRFKPLSRITATSSHQSDGNPREDEVSFKPLSRITATSSRSHRGLKWWLLLVSNPFRGSLPLHLL